MTGSESATEKKRCFVISPIGAKDSVERKLADKVLKHLIRKALGDLYQVERADESTNPGAITPAMVASILDADLIVADLTGQNPNVFYEVAMAHGYGKPTVHLQRAGEKVPFDVKDMRVINYDLDPDDLEAAQKALREAAKFAVEHPEKIESPLSNAQAFAALQESKDPAVESNVLILEAIDALRREVRRATPGRRTASNTAGAMQRREDLRSLREVLIRAVRDENIAPEHLESSITAGTSPEFDQWLLNVASRVVGSSDREDLQFLYAPDVTGGIEVDDGPDESLHLGH